MLFSKRELKFSRSFLSNMKKSGLNIALPFFVCTAIPACSANPTGIIPVIVTSSSPSASPVNSVGTGTTVVIGGSSNTGSPTPNPSVFETGPFGSITGNKTTVAQSLSSNNNVSAGNPWGPSNASIPISPSPSNGTWNSGSIPPSIGGSTIGAGATNDCSTSTATFGKTSGSQQIDVKATPCPKATSAGNTW